MTTNNVQDHLGREVNYSFPPKRIISLCPGITDTLLSLNLDHEVVGRTRYCIHPAEKVGQIQVVGGTKEIKMERIRELKPDLVIAEKEENTKEIVDEVSKHYPVYVAEVQSIDESFRMIHDIGEITNKNNEAASLIEKIKSGFESLPTKPGKRVAYVIWKKPYMVVGGNTYINSLLERMGFENPFTQLEGRYPAVTTEQFQQAKLDYLFLATEPFPFKEKHIEEFQEFLPKVKPMIIDGEMFWYGPRMHEAVTYFKEFYKNI